MPAPAKREGSGPDERQDLAARMRRARRVDDDDQPVVDAEVARHRLAPVPLFPVDALPEPLRSAVTVSATALGAPTDFVATGFLACVSTLAGSRVRLELRPGWTESACLYIAAVGEPSSKKTPALRWGLGPLHRIQAALFADAEAQAKEARERAKQERDGDGDEDREAIPEARHVAVADITVEALYEILHLNEAGVCAAWDELAGWVKSQNAYRNGFGSDREFWQAAWSGTPYYVDRKSRAENGQRLSYMLHPFVTVVGGIQPDVLLELTTTSRGRPAGRDGMLERLLFAWPDRGVGRPGAPVPKDVSKATRALFDQLTEMRFVRVDGRLEEVGQEHIAHLSEDGRTAWSEVEDAHWTETNDPAVPAWWKGVCGKLHAYHARLALIVAIVREGGRPRSVTAEDIRAAGALIAYFRATARRAWTALYGNQTLKLYGAILSWARRHATNGVTVREAVRAELAGIRTADDAREAFRELAGLGLGQFEVVERVGAKPAEVFWPGRSIEAPGGRDAVGSSGSSGGLSGAPDAVSTNGEKDSTGSSGLSGASLSLAGAADPRPPHCRACGGIRHWRIGDRGPWVCGTCHPPVAGAEVQWAPPDDREADAGVV